MKIFRRVSDAAWNHGMVRDHNINRDLRVLARAPAVEAVVVHIINHNNELVRVFDITLGKTSFEQHDCFDPMTFVTKPRLCALFVIDMTETATNKTLRELQWIAIDK